MPTRTHKDQQPHIGAPPPVRGGETRLEPAVRDEPGEITVAAALEEAVETVGGHVLHHRRMPGGRGGIDHIAIVPAGVHVIDTRAVTGRVEIRPQWLGPERLFIDGRDRSTYLDGLDRQIQVVRDAIDRIGCRRPLVQGALCFIGADLPVLRTQEVRGHLLLYRRALARKLIAVGPLGSDALTALTSALTASFPAA